MKTLITLLLCLLSTYVWGQCSPIVVDTRRDGIELGPAGRGVSFDVNADGFPDYVQWVRPRGDEAFLTLDRNRNGRRDATARLIRAHVVRHDPEGPPLHRCCRQLVAVLGMGRQRSARTGDHGRRLLPSARPDAHSPGTGKRRQSVRTAARSSSSFVV